jgi:peptide/nickel transport system permease protein
VKQLATLQLGTSSTSRQEVTTEIRQRFRRPSRLTIAAGLFAVIFGIPLGFLAAKHYREPSTTRAS